MQNFTEYVGTKSTFRLLNRGSAKALDKVAELYGINTFHIHCGLNLVCNYTHNLKSTEKGKEVLIVKTTIHDMMNKMIRVCIVSLWYIKVDAQSAILSQLCMDVLIYLIL